MAVNKSKKELRDRKEWEAALRQIAESTRVVMEEAPEVREARKARAKVDFRYFVETYLQSIAPDPCGDFQVELANQLMANPNNIGVAEWPREHAKSVFANVLFPLWLLINDELEGMICMCKTNPDACNQLSDIQAQLMENKLFIHDWGDQYNAGDWSDGDFTTIKGIRFVALGRDQSARGLRKGKRRPNYATGDDLDDDQLVQNLRRVKQLLKRFLSSVGGALAIKRWRMLIANNRIHPQGFLAHIVGDLKPGMPKRKNLIHSKVYAEVAGYRSADGIPTWHQKFTIEQLQAKYELLGPELADREYFHKYTVEGTLFKDSYFNTKKLPNPKEYKVIIGYFDPSFVDSATSDYKAMAVLGLWQKEAAYQVHVLRAFCRRCDLYEALSWMDDTNRSMPPGVTIIWYMEKQFINESFRLARDEFNNMHNTKVWFIEDDRDKGNKYARIVMMQPLFSTGRVYFNIDEINGADMEEGINQLKGIEPDYAGADDWPDALEGAWHHLQKHIGGAAGGEIRIGRRPSSKYNF